jgi:hypothetical protein
MQFETTPTGTTKFHSKYISSKTLPKSAQKDSIQPNSTEEQSDELQAVKLLNSL